MAEWLRRGLQILARRFDSGSGLQNPALQPSRLSLFCRIVEPIGRGSFRLGLHLLKKLLR
jgi:hypothetical protein